MRDYVEVRVFMKQVPSGWDKVMSAALIGLQHLTTTLNFHVGFRVEPRPGP